MTEDSIPERSADDLRTELQHLRDDVARLNGRIVQREKDNLTLRGRVNDWELMLQSIYDSKGWNTLQACHELRARAIEEPLRLVTRTLLGGKVRAMAKRVLRMRGTRRWEHAQDGPREPEPAARPDTGYVNLVTRRKR